jgi:hypothetical protein
MFPDFCKAKIIVYRGATAFAKALMSPALLVGPVSGWAIFGMKLYRYKFCGHNLFFRCFIFVSIVFL